MLDFSVTFIITVINITVLFFILKAILFKPVTKFMAERVKRVQDSVDQAERDKASAQKLLAEYEGKHNNADAEAAEILKIARENAAHEAERIIAEGKAEAADIVAVARKQFEAERQAVLAKLKVEAAALVMAASSKLIARELSGDDNRRYVNMLLDELAAHQKGRT
ncbi:MAG: ATP synthase F0 subunit B [Treponema sp.]|jgi:F-type H+-transporting ATPase subunit b|nr:ATP synthase F0 subunit B [Treponema sp.]